VYHTSRPNLSATFPVSSPAKLQKPFRKRFQSSNVQESSSKDGGEPGLGHEEWDETKESPPTSAQRTGDCSHSLQLVEL